MRVLRSLLALALLLLVSVCQQGGVLAADELVDLEEALGGDPVEVPPPASTGSSGSGGGGSGKSSPQTDVVVLDEKTFEHLTQAATGATTGDWLVKFYAPWCGHCKALEPVWEQTATELLGSVNVAKVDCTANRALSMRFNIRGIPTLMLFSKGRMYYFKEPRSVETLSEFARGGFKLHEGEKVPPPLSSYFAELEFVFRHAYQEALKDLKARRYFTYNTVLVLVPGFFTVVIILLIVVPVGKPKLPPRPAMTRRFPPNPAGNVQPTTGRAAPATSARDSALKEE